MIKEFREFLEKFNVIPIAVGLVLALAFQPLVDSVVAVILSLLGAIGGLDVDFSAWAPELNGTPIPFGDLITRFVGFIILAFIVFLIVKALAKAGARTELAETPDQALLGEIRDLLKSRGA